MATIKYTDGSKSFFVVLSEIRTFYSIYKIAANYLNAVNHKEKNENKNRYFIPRDIRASVKYKRESDYQELLRSSEAFPRKPSTPLHYKALDAPSLWPQFGAETPSKTRGYE